MPMKKTYALFAAVSLLFAACGDDEDILSQQQQRIVSFLTSTHTPRLVSEAELEEDSQLPFYTLPERGVYRYISSYYNPERATWPEVTPSSKVSVTFRMYEFRYAAITDSTVPFFTNDPMLEARFYNQLGLTPGVWSFEPATFDLAAGRILNGWRAALIGCRGGDDVEVYLTSDRAYGDENFAVVPKNNPVAVTFTIDRVE